MVRPRKHRAARKITKIFGDPREPRPQYTEEELIRLKEEAFYREGVHMTFPEFTTGCPECGSHDFHRDWCSSFMTNFRHYRRNADSQRRDLERQLSQDSNALPRYLWKIAQSGDYLQADNALTEYLGPIGDRWSLPQQLQTLLPSIFELGLMPGVYFEIGIEHTLHNPTTLEDFIEGLADELYYQYNETRRTLFQKCDKIDGDPVGRFAYAEEIDSDSGLPIYQTHQQQWLERLVIDRTWLETSMLRFSRVDRIKKGTRTKPVKTFYRVFIPAWALICIYGVTLSTTEGFSRSNRWEHCHTSWHTKNIRKELNESNIWPSDSRPRKFTLNGLLEWKTTPAFIQWLRS
jgi:hypothetical protein